MEIKDKTLEILDEKILLVELVMYGREVLVIGAYAPTNDTASVGKDTLRDILEEIPRRK
jgi:hypothetical protein